MEKFTVTAISNGGILSLPSKPQSRDVSFSSYLHSKPTIIDDSEISIFDADKYFNDSSNSPNNAVPQRYASSVASTEIVNSNHNGNRAYRSGSFHTTPTASSEASWNSQLGLLSHQPGTISVSMKSVNRLGHRDHGIGLQNVPKNRKESSLKWFFRRKCPCTGKKALQVEEEVEQSERSQSNKVVVSTQEPLSEMGKQYSGRFMQEESFLKETSHRVVPLARTSFNDKVKTNINTINGFSFPILSPSVVEKPPLALAQLEDPPRESLEVFKPVERKSTELPLGGNLRSFIFPNSPKARAKEIYEDDVISDASSDLFEIESFSTQSTMYPMYRRRDSLDDTRVSQYRQSLDETPSIAPTECYEPSEVSIDWSVTTAEGYNFGLGGFNGFDRGSVTNFSIAESEYEHEHGLKNVLATNMNSHHHNHNDNQLSNSKQRSSIGGGRGLLSCRWEKAVNVGPHPVKLLPEQHRSNLNSNFPFPVEVGRIQATLRAAPNKANISRSHSARMSRALATH